MENKNSQQTNYDIAEELFKRRYLLKDLNGKVVETPSQMFHRVANTAAMAELKYGADRSQVESLEQNYYQLMYELKFLPNSPTLMNAARKDGMLSACFVIPLEDSIVDIFDAVKITALIQKSGGGTGFTFDKLRPTGDRVASSGGTTSGPISFWQVLAETTHAIQQGAHRRGANMGMMSLEHPDILKFICAKQDLTQFNNFNISVKLTDAFMAVLRKNPDRPHIVTNPRTCEHFVIPKGIDVKTYQIQDLIAVDTVKGDFYSVGDIWQMIVRSAHASGEPGVCFIDSVNRANPIPHIGKINATNPCGEQPLLDYESCDLGSLNLSAFVRSDSRDLDWDELGRSARYALRFLDNIIDVNSWPVEQVRKATLASRKVGLGIMGFADALALLGITYNSQRAVDFARKVSAFIQQNAHQQSQQLAEEKGSFPSWQGSLWDTLYHKPMRNATCTTIAPTGSISLLAKCSSGIEPIYSPVQKRKALDGQEFIQLHPLIERLGTQQGWLDEKVRSMLFSGVDICKIPSVPKELAEVLVTAHQIEPQWHVRIQAAFQENIDNAVSKTVNLPADATIEDVKNVFQEAYELGSKGITVYRNQTRTDQVLSAAHAATSPDTTVIGPRARVPVTSGKTTKFRMGCGTLFVTVNKDEKGLCEVFANLGKAGGCPSQSEATCRAVSAALRSGVDPKVLIDQLSGIRCLSAMVARKSNKDVNVTSCPDAIAGALKKALSGDEDAAECVPLRICDECKRPMRIEANCAICDYCGITNCG